MKRILLLFFLVAAHICKANLIIVTVQNTQFTPNNFTASVGDVVRWVWVNGFHTTTSDAVPTGAATWDQALTSPGAQFDYPVVVSGTYSYHCTPHQSLGMVATFFVNAAGPTPVKLSYFLVKNQSKGTAVLNWQTQTEDNADHFSILRSENGKDFHEVGEVKAAGNSVHPINYSFTDNNLNPSTQYYYYQLQTVDVDTKEERSKILLLKQDVPNRNIIVKLSPNPVPSGDHIEFWFNADQVARLHAAIHDITGKLVYQADMGATIGVNFGHLHIHELPPGVYILNLTIGKLKESTKITVQ